MENVRVVAGALLVVAVLGLVAWAVIDESIHCTRWQPYPCTHLTCAAYDRNMNCTVWVPVATTCNRCVERDDQDPR